jgi:hypothetical protein
MNCYIKEILIFNANGDKKSVPLQQGLNIITGNSKTGKSALIEIVDYCFCSRTSSIPQGEITKFGYLYAIILAFPSKYLVIGRKKFIEGGNSSMYLKTETDINSVSDFKLTYFTNQAPLRINDARINIEQHFGMAITNITTDDYTTLRNKPKPNLRDMTSFFFQQQNIIANKHILFGTDDDTSSKQAIIDSFLVFLGLLQDEYYTLKREQESLTKKQREIETTNKRNEKISQEIKQELRNNFINYFKLIGKPFDNTLSFDDLIKLHNELPSYSEETFLKEDDLKHYHLLIIKRDEKSAKLRSIGMQIKDLEATHNYANSFQIGLETLDMKANNSCLELKIFTSKESKFKYKCPTCGDIHDELKDEMVKIVEAKQNVEKELKQIGTYAISYQKEIDTLKRQQNDLKKEIKILNKSIKAIEKDNTKIQENKKVSERAIYAQGRLDTQIEMYLKATKNKVDNDTEDLKGKLDIVLQKLTAYNIDVFYQKSNTFISENMNKIATKLDFEYKKPLDFRFSSKDFTLKYNYQEGQAGEIRMSEMGSGANWLACHLSLFLSLHHYFAIQENSIIPNILFLDQPSQVYFPNKFRESDKIDHDIEQVEKIYVAILEELEEIKNKTNFYPQVIVTDHADGLNLGKFSFDKYVRKRWKLKENEKALI